LVDKGNEKTTTITKDVCFYAEGICLKIEVIIMIEAISIIVGWFGIMGYLEWRQSVSMQKKPKETE